MIVGTLSSRRSAVLLIQVKALRVSHVCAIPHMGTLNVAAVYDAQAGTKMRSRIVKIDAGNCRCG